MTLDCGGIVGRYVTVMHPDIPPDVCEVEVYSTWEHLNNPFHQHPHPMVSKLISFTKFYNANFQPEMEESSHLQMILSFTLLCKDNIPCL